MKTSMHQPATVTGNDTRLEAPEFYQPGLVAIVACDYGRVVLIHREGKAWMRSQEDGTRLTSPEDYRDAWGMSGQIPKGNQGWDGVSSAGFHLYAPCGEPLRVKYTLAEAIEAAEIWLVNTGRQALVRAA